LLISPNIPPPLSANSLALLSGFGSILIISPVVGSFCEHDERIIKNRPVNIKCENLLIGIRFKKYIHIAFILILPQLNGKLRFFSVIFIQQ
jgi:hypothetical protein